MVRFHFHSSYQMSAHDQFQLQKIIIPPTQSHTHLDFDIMHVDSKEERKKPLFARDENELYEEWGTMKQQQKLQMFNALFACNRLDEL